MKIVTSLSFRGQCREAFEFYAKVLGGEITAAMPYSEGPPDMPVGEQYKDWLMHCWLQVGDQAIMGSDMDVEWAPNIDKPKNGFDVTLHTSDAAEGKRWFDALSDGGKVGMAFEPRPPRSAPAARCSVPSCTPSTSAGSCGAACGCATRPCAPFSRSGGRGRRRSRDRRRRHPGVAETAPPRP